MADKFDDSQHRAYMQQYINGSLQEKNKIAAAATESPRNPIGGRVSFSETAADFFEIGCTSACFLSRTNRNPGVDAFTLEPSLFVSSPLLPDF